MDANTAIAAFIIFLILVAIIAVVLIVFVIWYFVKMFGFMKSEFEKDEKKNRWK